MKTGRTEKFFTGAIFDHDGLLFDTEVIFERCWLEEGERLGLGITTDFTHRISGCGLKELIGIIKTSFPGIDADEFVARVHDAATAAQLASQPVMKKGAREILEFCRAHGIRTAVASSSMRHLVERNLSLSGLSEFFDEIVTGRDVVNGKPAPDIFLLAAKRIGIAPVDCVVFEDSLNGIRAAHASGSFAVMIPDRAQPTAEILELCETYPSLSDAIAGVWPQK